METNYNTQHHREKGKAKQNVINEFYYMKEIKMGLLKKKHNYHFKIVNQLIMKSSKCILLRKINETKKQLNFTKEILGEK